MNAENVDVCENAALFTVGAKRVPVGSFLATVIVAYTDFPQLEPALHHACQRHEISDFALVDLRRAIVQVMRDRGATVEADGAGTRFVWPSFDQPVRQRIVDGLRELAIHPGRWMTPDPAEPVDCEGDDFEVFAGLKVFDLPQRFWDGLSTILRVQDRFVAADQDLSALPRLDVVRADLYAVERAPDVRFTCTGCRAAPTCPWFYDAYNTDNDCLGEK